MVLNCMATVLWGDAAYDRRSLGCPCAWAAPAIELAHGRPLGHTGPRRCAASGMEGVQGGGCGEVSSLWLLLSPLLPAGPCSRQGPLPWVDPTSLLPSQPSFLMKYVICYIYCLCSFSVTNLFLTQRRVAFVLRFLRNMSNTSLNPMTFLLFPL